MVGIFFYVGAGDCPGLHHHSVLPQEQGIDARVEEAAGTVMVTVRIYLLMDDRPLAGQRDDDNGSRPENCWSVLGLLRHGAVVVSHVYPWRWSRLGCLVLCGLANSIMYPTIFALGIAELGPLTSKGSGVITIGNFGGAVIPPLFGFLADRIGIQYAFVIPIIGYLYMVVLRIFRI